MRLRRLARSAREREKKHKRRSYDSRRRETLPAPRSSVPHSSACLILQYAVRKMPTAGAQ